MDNQLGNRIKRLRLESDFTQSQLARKLEVSPALISAYELGERKPSIEILVSLASTFQVSTDYLLGLKSQQAGGLEGLSLEEVQALRTLIKSLKVRRQG